MVVIATENPSFRIHADKQLCGDGDHLTANARFHLGAGRFSCAAGARTTDNPARLAMGFVVPFAQAFIYEREKRSPKTAPGFHRAPRGRREREVNTDLKSAQDRTSLRRCGGGVGRPGRGFPSILQPEHCPNPDNSVADLSTVSSRSLD